MPLKIQPRRAVYNDERDTVTFLGLDDGRLVRCSVTREALCKLAKRRAKSARKMLATYNSYAERIHQVAVRKYEKRQLATDGSVLIQLNDIEPSQ